jgi:hypothetical protein
MDKQLLKAYIRTIVEDEVSRILPQMLSEAVSEVKQLKENAPPTTSPSRNAPKIDRGRLAELMNISYDGHTLQATTSNMPSRLPENTPKDADPEVVKAITKDYSALMKALKLT